MARKKATLPKWYGASDGQTYRLVSAHEDAKAATAARGDYDPKEWHTLVHAAAGRHGLYVRAKA